MQDSHGYMWFTTFDGVSRFDGLECKSNNEIAPGAEGLSVADGMVEDAQGNIWFGLNGHLLCFNYRTNRFDKLLINWGLFHQQEDSVIHYKPKRIVGNLMLVHFTLNRYAVVDLITLDVVHIFDFKLDESISWPPEVDGLVGDLPGIVHIDNSNYIFQPVFGSGDKRFWQRKALKDVVSPYNQECMLHSADTAIFFCDSNGEIWSYNLQKQTARSIAKGYSSRIDHLEIDRQGLLWAAGIGGIFVTDIHTGELIAHFGQEPKVHWSLPGKRYLNTYISDDDILWVSVWGKGVSYAPLQNDGISTHFTDKEAESHGADNFIRGIVEGANGHFYCNSSTGGILELDNRLLFIRRLSDTESHTIHTDKEGMNIYFSNKMVYKYDLSTGQTRILSQPTQRRLKYNGSTNIYHFAQRNNGHTLLASTQGVWNMNVDFSEITDVPGVNDSNIYVNHFAYEDARGNIYKHSLQDGLEYLSSLNDTYRSAYTFPEKWITFHMLEENDSTVWIGTSAGLILFNPQELQIREHITTAHGLPNNTVYAIADDGRGKLWLSTNRGIASLRQSDGFIKQYPDQRGLGSVEFNAHAVVKARDGRIIFGGTCGLTSIDPSKTGTREKIPRLIFTSINTDSVLNPYPFNKAEPAHLKLSAGINAIEIGLTVLDYLNPSAQRIRYRMQGVDNAWVVRDNPSLARYVQLPPGEYTFEAAAANEDGTWSTSPKLLHIELAAFWWQEWWFKIVAFAVFMMIAFALLSFYKRHKIRETNWKLDKEKSILHERERITADLHDDVGATLSSMHIYSELANQTWDNQPAFSRDMLVRIKQQSGELMGRMNDIIWSLKPSAAESHTFLDRLKNYSADLLAAKGIQVNYNFDTYLPPGINDPMLRKNLLLVAKEAFNNIAKHSDATFVEVSLKIISNELIFKIADNGKGIGPDETIKGNGLKNMALRCSQLSGTLEVGNKSEKGFSLTCRLPMARISYLDR